MKIRLDDLEEKAKAVNHGDWSVQYVDRGLASYAVGLSGTLLNWGMIQDTDIGHSMREQEAQFVSAMNPTTALALIRVARAARDYYFAPYCDDHECGCHEAHHEDLKEALKEIEA